MYRTLKISKRIIFQKEILTSILSISFPSAWLSFTLMKYFQINNKLYLSVYLETGNCVIVVHNVLMICKFQTNTIRT